MGNESNFQNFQNGALSQLREEVRKKNERQRELMQRNFERLRNERQTELGRRIREMRQNSERERERNNIHFPFLFNNQRENEVNNTGHLDAQFFGNLFNQIMNISSNMNNLSHNNNNRNNNERINDNNNERNNDNNNINNNNNIGDMLEEIYISQNIIDKAENKQCPICLEEYSIENKICYLPCFHFFHSECIKNWLKKSNNCPLCKVDVKFDE